MKQWLGPVGLCSLLMLSSLTAQAVDAATGDALTANLGTVVVTGTRTEKTLADTPVRTEVVTREELERTHAQTLTQALENVPGVLLTPVHGKPGYKISMQGLSSDEVLVLIDGLPITASTGSTVDLSQYLIGEVDHIEVVKGAASAQYGSSAMGGVINVITRPIQPGLAGQVEADLGTHLQQNPSGDAWDPAVKHARSRVEGGTDKLRFRLDGDALSDQGFAVEPSAWPRQGAKLRRGQFSARGEWHPTPSSELWLAGNHYRELNTQRFNFFVPPTQVPQHNDEDVTRDRITWGGHWRDAQGLRFSLKGVTERYRSTTGEYSNDYLNDTRKAHMGTDHVTAQVDLPAWYRQLWQFGTTFHHATLKQTVNGASELADGTASRTSYELFTQDDVLFDERWELLLGLRWQHDSDFGPHAAPKAGLRFTLVDDADWNALLRASVGQGYRVPNLKERHYRFDHSALGYVVIGNPDLKPESSTSFQFGGQIARSGVFSLNVNLFENLVKDLIQVDETNAPVVNGITQFTYANVARARTWGVETVAVWHLLPTLDLRAGYTWLHTHNDETGTELTRQPRHNGRVGLDWQALPTTSLVLRARMQSGELISTDPGSNVGDGHSPGWVTVDFDINQKLGAHATVFVAADNLLNRQRDFSNPDDFGPEAGRLIRIGLRYDFGLPSTSPL